MQYDAESKRNRETVSKYGQAMPSYTYPIRDLDNLVMRTTILLEITLIFQTCWSIG